MHILLGVNNLIKITANAYNEMICYFKNHHKEQGGILGEKNDIIVSFYGDLKGKCNVGSYEPDVDTLNSIIEKWYNDDIVFRGLIHSHIGGCPFLSLSDKAYAKEIAKAMDFQKLLFPLVVYKKDNFIIYPFIYENNKWKEEKWEIVD